MVVTIALISDELSMRTSPLKLEKVFRQVFAKTKGAQQDQTFRRDDKDDRQRRQLSERQTEVRRSPGGRGRGRGKGSFL